jgi:hypothetical protein
MVLLLSDHCCWLLLDIGAWWVWRVNLVGAVRQDRGRARR